MQNRIACKQMAFALEFHKWKPTKASHEWLRARYSGTLTTLATEELVGAANNYRELKRRRKCRRPERCAQLLGNCEVMPVAAES